MHSIGERDQRLVKCTIPEDVGVIVRMVLLEAEEMSRVLLIDESRLDGTPLGFGGEALAFRLSTLSLSRVTVNHELFAY